MQVLHGTLLQPISADNCHVSPNTAVTIGDDGRIGQIRSAPATAGAIGGEGCWILPGFIDAHLHVPQWDRRGIDGLSALEWQKTIGYPAEIRLASVEAAKALATDFVRGAIANGTTTIAAYGS